MIKARVHESQRLPRGQTVLPWRADPRGVSCSVSDVGAVAAREPFTGLSPSHVPVYVTA